MELEKSKRKREPGEQGGLVQVNQIGFMDDANVVGRNQEGAGGDGSPLWVAARVRQRLRAGKVGYNGKGARSRRDRRNGAVRG